MKLLFVVQRYGREIAGGAEAFCRDFATRLVQRGHDVTVLTSRATSYVDWANELEEGVTVVDGVEVHRLSVARAREDRQFGPLNARVLGGKVVPGHLQESWMTMQGPLLTSLPEWLSERAASFDAAAFFTYLYYSTWAGLPVASALTPTILHPTAHDEPPLYLPIFDVMFRLPHGFGYLTEEERLLVDRRFGITGPFAVTGIGIELDKPSDAARFRDRYDIAGPYLLYVGRLDPHKGSTELHDHFVAYKRRNPGPLKLVVMGDPVRPLPPHPDIVVTGFVDEQTKHDAYDGALSLVHPSYFESFSLVLAEAWAHRRPAIVQGRSAVLAGQARRSGGGLPYVGFAEFEAAVDIVQEDQRLAHRLGSQGRAYVEARYEWGHVLDVYERFVGAVIDDDPARRTLRRARHPNQARSA
jgi:glycosyltransferase involved in cell wall biosynthesis